MTWVGAGCYSWADPASSGSCRCCSAVRHQRTGDSLHPARGLPHGTCNIGPAKLRCCSITTHSAKVASHNGAYTKQGINLSITVLCHRSMIKYCSNQIFLCDVMLILIWRIEYKGWFTGIFELYAEIILDIILMYQSCFTDGWWMVITHVVHVGIRDRAVGMNSALFMMIKSKSWCPASPENRRPSATGLLLRTHLAALLSPICTCSKRPRAGNAP